jgi:hypothetical protein
MVPPPQGDVPAGITSTSFEVAGDPVAQVKEEVILHLTLSPPVNDAEV